MWLRIAHAHHCDVLGRVDGEVVFQRRSASPGILALLGENYIVPTFHQSCPLDLLLDPIREVLFDLKERVQVAGVDRLATAP